ncbi:MAG TPA: hypothetical protein VMT82_00460 [candidate division Zixibacteria bacterium]|nr:hypothetical protein [candidate division Zixibacteria bacterium]
MTVKCMLAVMVLALPAWAQVNTSPATVNRVRDMLNTAGTQPTASAPARPAVASDKVQAPAANAPVPQVKPAVTKRKKHARHIRRTAVISKKVAQPEVKPQAAAAPEMKDAQKTDAGAPGKKRDPFVSPIVEKVNKAPCSAGKKCLPVADATLKGVIHTRQGDVAVVVNPEDKAYFLRVNDPVFDGVVLSISRNSIVFRETYSDAMGRALTREVVKKIQGPA